MTFRVVWTNQYNQDLGLIHSINDNHLESPNEGISIDHQKPTRRKLKLIRRELKKRTVADKLLAEEACCSRTEASCKRRTECIWDDIQAGTLGDVQTGPADNIQVDPSRSKSRLVNQIRVELKAEKLYSLIRIELSYEV
ncbi:cysteine repeat modular protein 2ue, putative (ISS) [Dorcoceras hygrometricum]|uniref:Cysteine repeat modular protein 2ue, putative (ISS) n=1 Tax=Dorcoceras hygrometricum TaxID=472368 RepID=A0A2Z7DI94_9LAMI|nr:cysteine repeat modular protein 2ue, putative (ISS) [Dorcoceras hygrometricum]